MIVFPWYWLIVYFILSFVSGYLSYRRGFRHGVRDAVMRFMHMQAMSMIYYFQDKQNGHHAIEAKKDEDA